MIGTAILPNNTLRLQANSTAKIHYLVMSGNTEGVLLECNGKFGMVDSGEDNDYPDGNDVRYPFRSGTIKGNGSEDKVIEYMKSLGVTKNNFEFYIGTHAHSDHIGSADEVIREFQPKRVYIQEYKDSYIRNPSRLWDNQYCYDNMIQAAKEVGASIILGFDKDAPLSPDKIVVTGQITFPQNEDQGSEDIQELSEETDSIENEDAEDDIIVETSEDLSEESFVETYAAGSEETFVVRLWNNNQNIEVGSKEITDSLQNTPVEFTGMPKYDEDGREIIYSMTVEKENVSLDCSVDLEYRKDETNEEYVGLDHFSLGGDMNIQICNYGDFYKYEDAVNDANDFCIGVLVTANNKRVFLSGDINNSADGMYAESRMLNELQNVDILTLGHHGAYGSNSYDYVSGLNPQIMVLSGNYSYVSSTKDENGNNTCETLRIMSERGVPLYVTGWYWYENELDALVFSLGSQITSNIPEDTKKIAYSYYNNGGSALFYHNGLQEKYNGWFSANGYVTYFDNSAYGLKAKKWMKDPDGYYHYFDGSGICKMGWLLCGGKYYYLGSDAVMVTGWQTISGLDYHFSPTGELYYGWQKKSDGTWLYYDNKGNVVTGWIKSSGYWYYLGENGYMLTGKQEINGMTYYLLPDGKMKTGWNNESGVWFYYNSDGSMRTGWLLYKNSWYYLDENGSMLTGKQEVNGKTYYLLPDGKMKTGWNDESGVWFYYNSDGSMRTGWLRYKKDWYYLSGDGSMLTGKQEINGQTYYLLSSGKMKTGWNKEGDIWYYYGPSGAMCTNKWISGKYYLKEDGTMAVSEWVDSDRYYVDQNGCWVPGKVK